MVLQNIVLFLVSTLFSMYIGAVVLRFLFAWSRANFYNPIAQFVVKVTNPPLTKLRKWIPAIGKIDTAAVILALVLKFILIVLVIIIQGASTLVSSNIFYIVLLAMIDLIRTVVWIYIIALIIQAVMSWTGGNGNTPMGDLLESLTRPLLRPIQRYVSPIASIDLSPMVAIIILNVALIVLSPFPSF